jgi:hypothetical protein
MSNDVRTQNEMIKFFKAHPLLIVSLYLLICSIIGFTREYLILGKFNINVADYADLDDFLLGAFKSPLIILYTFISFLILAVVMAIQLIFIENTENTLQRWGEKEYGADKSKNADIDSININDHITKVRKRLKYQRAFFSWIYIVSISVTIIISYDGIIESASKHVKEIKENGKHYYVVALRTNKFLTSIKDKNLFYISSTKNYMFFYHREDETVFTIPIASISNVEKIQYSEGSLQSPIQQKCSLYVATNTLHLRELPDRLAKVITDLPENTVLNLIATDLVWSNIKVNNSNIKGWVHSHYLLPVTNDNLKDENPCRENY